MEENFSHMIEMAMAVLLFIFGLSVAVVSYNRIKYHTDEFMYTNTENRRGRAADDRLDIKSNTDTDTDIQRKVDYGEIVMMIMNLPKNIVRDGEGNVAYHRIQINKKDKSAYVVCYDSRENGGIYILDGSDSNWMNPAATGKGPYSQDKHNLKDLVVYLGTKGIVQSGAQYTISYNKSAGSNNDAANLIVYNEI